MSADCFDPRETRDPAERERDLFARLPAQIAHAKQRSSYYAEALAAVDPTAVASRRALAQLPVLRKHQLIELQPSRPPFGGLEGTPLNALAQVFASPGPIYEAEGREDDNWRFARGMYAAGFRPGDLIHNTFSYHFTPGGFMAHGGAKKLGCPVFAAGVGQSEQQIVVGGEMPVEGADAEAEGLGDPVHAEVGALDRERLLRVVEDARSVGERVAPRA